MEVYDEKERSRAMKRKTLADILGRALQRFFIAALVTGLALGAGPTSVAHAATITVNSTADAVDAAPGDGVCATAAKVCTLRAAVQEANALAGDDTISLPAGTYTLTIAGAETNAASGDLDVKGNLTITGAGAATTIIDGNGGVTGDRVFYVLPGNVVTITGATIQNGNPGSGFIGGGIYNAGTLTVVNSAIAGNSAGNGGAIYNDNLGTLTLINSTVMGNTATFGYGAIDNAGTLILTNSTVSGNNTIGDGGGVHNDVSGTLTLENSTVSGNNATGVGGGILNYGGVVNLNNVTITNNTANGSGGIHNAGGTVNFKNTLIAGNTSSGASPDCGGTLTSQGYNLIQNTAGCTIVGDATGNVTGQDPLLTPLSNNGGATQTHGLLSGSPAIDAGNPTAPGSGGNACEASDQRGIARPQGTQCDIGAVEISFQIYLPLILR